MSVLMTLEVPGGTTAKYDRTNEILGIAGEHDAPPGLITHVCGITDDGILMVDVWDSVASLEDFAHNRLGAALEQAGMPGARPQTSPVHNFLFGAGQGVERARRDRHAGFTAEVYDAIVAKMPAHVGSGEAIRPCMHVAALEPDGHIRVVDLWDSEEAFGEFAADQIGPAAAATACRRSSRASCRSTTGSTRRARPRPSAAQPRRRRAPSAKLAKERGTRDARATVASSASASHVRSSSSTVSGGRPLITAMPWPATWLRIRWSRNSGTTTSCAKRPGLNRSSMR